VRVTKVPRSGFRLHHVQIAVPPGCEAEARAFYVDLLGMAEIPKPPHLSGRGGIWMQLDRAELHVGTDVGFKAAAKAHPAFEVGDLDALRSHLAVAGVKTWDDGPLPGHRRFYTHDPFGNRLEFVTPIVPA
jgi:catechol 2,3-dioxygenase-like lactoylglutathione lyase family enzyme